MRYLRGMTLCILLASCSLLVACGGTDAEARVETGGYTLDVGEQALDQPDQLVVDYVQSIGPSWVVIYDVAADGSRGQIIGHRLVKDGINQDVTVSLDRAVSSGEELIAIIHLDSPSDGQFQVGKQGQDPPALDEDADEVTERFTIL